MIGPMSAATSRSLAAVRRISSKQFGLITTAQLRAAGLDPDWKKRARRAGFLSPIRRSVFALPGSSHSWHRSVLAAVLAAGPDAVASQLTAAALWGLLDEPGAQANAKLIHVTAPRQHRFAGVVVHRASLPPVERSTRTSIPVTSVARTLLDLAQTLDADQLGECVDDALRRRIVNLAALRRTYEAHAGPGRRRLGPLRLALAARVPGFDPGANSWERAMDDLWDRLGLPASRRQYRLKVGARSYRLDRAIPELRLAVEWVGSEFHGQLGRYREDRLRISDLVQAGWDVVEVAPGWTPERLTRTVMTKVEERTRLLAAG